MDNEGFNLSANIAKLGACVYGCDLSFSTYAEVAPSILSSFPRPVLSSVLLRSPTQNSKSISKMYIGLYKY